MQNYPFLYCFVTIAIVSVIALLIVIYISEFIYKGKMPQDFIAAFPKRAKRISIFFLAYLLMAFVIDVYRGNLDGFLVTFLATVFVFVVIATMDTMRVM